MHGIIICCRETKRGGICLALWRSWQLPRACHVIITIKIYKTNQGVYRYVNHRVLLSKSYSNPNAPIYLHAYNTPTDTDNADDTMQNPSMLIYSIRLKSSVTDVSRHQSHTFHLHLSQFQPAYCRLHIAFPSTCSSVSLSRRSDAHMYCPDP